MEVSSWTRKAGRWSQTSWQLRGPGLVDRRKNGQTSGLRTEQEPCQKGLTGLVRTLSLGMEELTAAFQTKLLSGKDS